MPLPLPLPRAARVQPAPGACHAAISHRVGAQDGKEEENQKLMQARASPLMVRTWPFTSMWGCRVQRSCSALGRPCTRLAHLQSTGSSIFARFSFAFDSFSSSDPVGCWLDHLAASSFAQDVRCSTHRPRTDSRSVSGAPTSSQAPKARVLWRATWTR